MNFNFTYKNKSYSLDVKECKTIFSKFVGIMFQSNPKPQLFIFKNPTQTPIHSFFCKPFIAIWFDEKNKILEIRHISPWRLSIKPKKSFSKLLEIPKNSSKYQLLLDKIRKV